MFALDAPWHVVERARGAVLPHFFLLTYFNATFIGILSQCEQRVRDRERERLGVLQSGSATRSLQGDKQTNKQMAEESQKRAKGKKNNNKKKKKKEKRNKA